MKNKLHKLIACSTVAVALSIASLAYAHVSTGTVLNVRSCYDTATSRKIFIFVDRDDASNIWIYLGVESAGSHSLSALATSALLSGKKIKFINGTSAASYCAGESPIDAFNGSGTGTFIEIQAGS